MGEVTCGNCGACCMEMSSPPFVCNEWRTVPYDLQHGIGDYLDGRRYNESGPCCWLDLATGECQHYEHRPQVCREDLQVGDDGCKRWRVKYPG